MATTEEVFGVRTLNGMVEKFAAEAGLNSMFRDLFRMGRQFAPEGTVAEWDEVQFARHLAPVVGPDAPFPLVQNTTVTNRSSSMAHIKIAKRIPASKLFNERAPGSLTADGGLYVASQIRDALKLIGNTVEYMCAQSLLGTLTVNSTNIPGTTVPFTITYSPNTYSASASWATVTTDIPGTELGALKQDFLQTSGLLPRLAITAGAVQGYIAKNDFVTLLLQNQSGELLARSAATLIGTALEGFELGGLRWKVNESGYVPEGGSFTRYMGSDADKFILLPDESQLGDVLGFAEGYGLVPTGNGLASAEQAASLVARAPGRGLYSYAHRAPDNPADVFVYIGWVGLPIVMQPSAVCIANTTP